MKKIILIVFLLSSLCSFSKNLPKYKASNGITYSIGSEIIMGEASGENDYYVYMWITSALAKGGGIKGRAYNGLPVTIKKIRRFKSKNAEKVLFLVGGGNITNYTLDIENAIASCEIKDCIEKVNKVEVVRDAESKYDELKKLKELLDSGAITQNEFEKEKKKILNGK
jgi:hypothetical protein